MKKNNILLLTYIIVVTFFIIGATMVFLVFPTQTGFYAALKNKTNMQIVMLIELISYFVLSIPCFILLFAIVRIAKMIQSDGHYSNEFTNIIKKSGLMLVLDSSAFVVVNVVFIILTKSFSHEVLYMLLGIIGLTIGVVLLIATHYWNETIKLKQENEEFV